MPLIQPTQSNGVHGLIGDIHRETPDELEKEAYWNCFASLVSKMGVVPDREYPLQTLQDAEEALKTIIAGKNEAVDEGLRLNEINIKLKEEVSAHKKTLGYYGDISKNDSTAIDDGIEAQKKLNDVKSVLPVQPEEMTKKGVWKAMKLFTHPYEKRIKELEGLIKRNKEEDKTVKKPWWTYLPSLGR